MVREIIIGKEGNQPFQITDARVSRKHAKITIDENGDMVLEDLQSTNGTFVLLKNGNYKRITQQKLTKGMTVRFGPELEFKVSDLINRYLSKEGHAPAAAEYDITPLKYLEENYNREKVIVEQKLSSNGMFRMAVFSLGGIMATITGFVLTDPRYRIVAPLVTLLVAGLGFLILIRQSNKLIRRRNMCDSNFKRNFVCPHCHMSFVGKMYANIRLVGKCPNCKSKFSGEF